MCLIVICLLKGHLQTFAIFPVPDRKRRRPIPVPMTGVRYNSLLWMCTLNTIWPDLTSVIVALSCKLVYVNKMLKDIYVPVFHHWCNKVCGMCWPVWLAHEVKIACRVFNFKLQFMPVLKKNGLCQFHLKFLFYDENKYPVLLLKAVIII